MRRRLLDEFGIEIGGGLGPLKGKTWRIGLMGESSSTANVLLVLTALERVLPRYGHANRTRLRRARRSARPRELAPCTVPPRWRGGKKKAPQRGDFEGLGGGAVELERRAPPSALYEVTNERARFLAVETSLVAFS